MRSTRGRDIYNLVNQASLGLGDKNHLLLVCQNRLVVGRVGKF